jgi:hypothetical protein
MEKKRALTTVLKGCRALAIRLRSQEVYCQGKLSLHAAEQAVAFVSFGSVTLGYSWAMPGRLRKALAHHLSLREETAFLEVGRDLWMIAVGTVLILSNYLMQVSIEIDNLPHVIVFVR